MSDINNIAIIVTKFLDKAFEAWNVFISTRQEAYERKMDKSKRRAIDYAEQIILLLKTKDLDDKKLDKLIVKFFKYNN